MTSSQAATAITTTDFVASHRAEAAWALVWASVDHHLASKRVADDLRLGNLGALGGCSVRATAGAAQSRIAEMGEQELRP